MYGAVPSSSHCTLCDRLAGVNAHRHAQARGEIESIVETADSDGKPIASLDGLVSCTNWKMISNALDSRMLIAGDALPPYRPGGKPPVLYYAALADDQADSAETNAS